MMDCWVLGVKGRMWCVIKKMYEVSRSSVLLEGEKSTTFSLEQGVAQGCKLSPILFSAFIDDLFGFWRLRKIVACSQSSSQCLLVSTVFGMVSSPYPTSFLMIFILVNKGTAVKNATLYVFLTKFMMMLKINIHSDHRASGSGVQLLLFMY